MTVENKDTHEIYSKVEFIDTIRSKSMCSRSTAKHSKRSTANGLQMKGLTRQSGTRSMRSKQSIVRRTLRELCGLKHRLTHASTRRLAGLVPSKSTSALPGKMPQSKSQALEAASRRTGGQQAQELIGPEREKCGGCTSMPPKKRPPHGGLRISQSGSSSELLGQPCLTQAQAHDLSHIVVTVGYPRPQPIAKNGKHSTLLALTVQK